MPRRRHHYRRDRRGASAVEFAVAAPILILLVFGAIESMMMYTVVSSLENAAYEGARKGIVPGASADAVVSKAESILTAARVRGYEVRVSPSQILPHTRTLTVEVSARCGDNSLGLGRFFASRSIRRSFTLAREGYAGSELPSGDSGGRR